MNENQDLKKADLDHLIGDNRSQMIKAALPYMDVPEQRVMSLMVKVGELKRTIQLFKEGEVASMGICSLDKKSASPLEMLNTIKPYGTPSEQEFIDLICNFMQGFHLYRSYQETMDSSEKPPQKPPLEHLKAILPAEQQSRLETMQLMMQAMQQFT